METKTIRERIGSIDLLRGLVMLIMAIDHVRDNFLRGSPDPTDLNSTTPVLFLTRWITHFCAPTFVFLSGVSIFLAGTRRSEGQLSVFLVKRGLWLILVEVTVISFAFFLNPHFQFILLQVIWAIGGGMVILGVLIRLKMSPATIGTIGAVIFFGHNLLDYMELGSLSHTTWWQLLWTCEPGPQSIIRLGGGHFVFMAYALLPWTGVMMLGYFTGTLYDNAYDPAKRRKTLLYSGLSLLALFLLLRAFNLYGDPHPWSIQSTVTSSILSFLNVTKYPCSLLYLSMTLGVALIILACSERATGWYGSLVRVYGQVPFFYYILHWYLIQAIHIGLFFAMGYKSSQIVDPGNFFRFLPKDFGLDLFGIYIIWLLVVVLAYWPCKWFGNYKRTHRQWWVSYL